MSPFRFRWGSRSPSEEDHPAPVWPARTLRGVRRGPSPDWQRPVMPVDPCGSGPIKVKDAPRRDGR